MRRRRGGFDEAKREFGRRLAARRAERRLTVVELARRVGQPSGHSYVYRLEAGRGNPGIEMLVRLGRTLALDPGDLTRGLTPATFPAVPLGPVSPEAREHPMVAVGHRVRARRRQLGLTQEGLSEQAGIHDTHIRQIEYGHIDIKLETLLRLAGGLECDVGDLLQGL